MPNEDGSPTVEEQLATSTESLQKEIAGRQAERQKRQSLEKSQAELRTQLDELQATQTAATEAAEQSRLEGEGNYKEALANKDTAHATAQSVSAATITELTSALQTEAGTNQLHLALGAAGVISERIGQASTLLASRVKVTQVDGKAHVEIFDTAGVAMVTESGEPATMADLAAQFAADNSHYMPPSGDRGAGAFAGGGSVGTTLAELDADANKKLAFIQKHGDEAYQKLHQAARIKRKEKAAAE